MEDSNEIKPKKEKKSKTKNNDRFGNDLLVCSDCVEYFKEKELSVVKIHRENSSAYATYYCTPCVIKNKIPKEDIRGNAFELRVSKP